MKRGIFISVDGIDGAGKTTQKKILVSKLKRTGRKVKEIKFPQYGKRSAWQIEQYLNGFFGDQDSVDPYFTSLLYADDRLEAKAQIEKWLKEGKIVVSDRYAAANAGHQGGKITSPRKRKRYLEWLWKTEFEINRIPMPDLNIILWISPTVAHRLIFKKDKRGYLKKSSRRDGHERSLQHLRRAAASYKWIAGEDPKHFKVINCMNGRLIASLEEIHEKIWKAVVPIISRLEAKKPRH